ncbi:Transposase [Archaeoglobus fulgidus DSM 8774]|uniref:Transposase n=1 Tax=Archaeoglobus fulgidus DSM 8774 TaxID=1344584 RepID=A0A075WLP4_ARCFL|nr:IS6 family transposase [Archaeoglobus fulgidus]AIG98463.1 Transposase [Archaeoglobus fulgidus DSM 8774]
MQPALRQLVDYIKSTKVFRRNKKDVELKILAALLYFFGLSLRKTSDFLSLFEEISHESVRIYYHRLKEVIKPPRKKPRRLIAIDETKLKLENTQIFVWTAIDVDSEECLAIWASEGRSSFHAYVFLREVLKYCENKPKVVVDRGFWYLWALKRLGLRYRHETFGERNAVEGFFSRFKERTKRFWNRFPFNSSFNSVQSWIESFIAFYNYWRC